MTDEELKAIEQAILRRAWDRGESQLDDPGMQLLAELRRVRRLPPANSDIIARLCDLAEALSDAREQVDDIVHVLTVQSEQPS